MMQHTTVGSILRAEQAYGLQLCEKETLDYGITYTNERFSKLPDFCQFREVVIENPSEIPKAFDETEKWFTERSLTCRRWVPAAGGSSDELSDFLTERGFRRSVWTAFALPDWPDLDAPDDVRILPARAMRSAFRRALADTAPADQVEATDVELWVEAHVERLDDPPYDACVALIDGKPAGWYALHQVGDIGRIAALSVSPAFAGRGAEAAMMAHGLALAHRLMLQLVCATVAERDDQRRDWLDQAGFVPDGEIIQYDRIETPDTTP